MIFNCSRIIAGVAILSNSDSEGTRFTFHWLLFTELYRKKKNVDDIKMMFLLAYHYICQTWLLKRGFFTIFIICCFRRGFGLPQRLQLRILKNFVSEKLGKSCEKSGEHWIKSGNREIFRGFIFLLYPRLRFYMSDRDEMFLSVSIFHHINK